MPTPDFVCIGAQKAGTTWLYQHLSHHPGVNIPLKEINYFRRDLPTRAGEDTDAGYLSLFAPQPGQICGDISPTYCRCNDAEIDHLYRLSPAARIIYILRNPVHRDWSAIRMRMALDGGSPEDWLAEVAHQSRYLQHIERWRRRFGERLSIFFFDQLEESPVAFHATICKLLGLETADASTGNAAINDKIFEGPPTACPPRIWDMLCRANEGTIRGCHALFSNKYTEAWLQLVR